MGFFTQAQTAIWATAFGICPELIEPGSTASGFNARWPLLDLGRGTAAVPTARDCRAPTMLLNGRLLRRVLLLPFLPAQLPWYEHVGQALRFCLCDLVKMKAVPARTCTRLGLDLGEQTLNAKGAGLHGCWSSRAQPGRQSGPCGSHRFDGSPVAHGDSRKARSLQ